MKGRWAGPSLTTSLHLWPRRPPDEALPRAHQPHAREGGAAGTRGRHRPWPRIGALVLLVCGPALSGCWDRVEVNNLAIVDGAAFDAVPTGGIQVTLQIVVPGNLPNSAGMQGGGGGGSSGGQPPVTVVTASGPSISAVESELQQRVPGHIFWGDCRAVVIGQALAQAGIGEVLDFFLRERRTRLETDLLVTQGEAGPYLQVTPPYHRLPFDNLYQTLLKRELPREPVYQAAMAALETGAGFLVPVVAVRKSQPPGQTPGGGGGGGGGGQAPVAENLAVVGTAVFAGQRWVGTLDASQGRGALWLSGQALRGSAVLSYDGAEITTRIERTAIRRRAVRRGSGVAISLAIQVEDTISEVNGPLRLSRPSTLRGVAALLSAEIERRAETALRATQGMGVDPFGELIAAYQPWAWERMDAQWPQGMAQVPVEIHAAAHVRFAGNLIDGPAS